MNFSSTLLHVNQPLWLLQIIWTGKLNKRCKTFLKEADSFPLVGKGMIRCYIMVMGGILLFLVISAFPLSLPILAYPWPFICLLTHKFHILADMKRREQHIFSLLSIPHCISFSKFFLTLSNILKSIFSNVVLLYSIPHPTSFL